ncbi:MAG: cysteine peptidase family C39 domain-containing protein [Acidobacteriota bacterium]|nr:cysteine peptidase family C39 domain-containing protein [Acidobacteriota bacterium]
MDFSVFLWVILFIIVFQVIKRVRGRNSIHFWKKIFVPEYSDGDRGTPCLAMIFEYYGLDIPILSIKQKTGFVGSSGVSLVRLAETAGVYGFRTRMSRVSRTTLFKKSPLPAIVPWEGNGFVVLIKATADHCYAALPWEGVLKMTHADFLHGQQADRDGVVVLFLEYSGSKYR